MSKRIPEVIDLDTQAMRLLSTFSGSMDFEAVRGKCGGEFLSITDTFMREEDGLQKAPSAGVKDLKAFLTSFANIRNKIAQLERDGFTLAAHEARKALGHPDYRMLGEIHPFEKTVPVTLVMFNPKLTLAVLGKSNSTNPQWLNTEDAPEELMLPSYRTRDTIFREELLLQLRGRYSRVLEERLQERLPKKYSLCRKLETSSLLSNNPKMSTEVEGYSLGLAYYAKKINVLRCFTQKEREQIAVWQFYLPKVHSDLYVGLHLSAENNYWENKRAPFCSVNSFHGYGAIAYPGEAYRCFDKRSQRFKGTRILLY